MTTPALPGRPDSTDLPVLQVSELEVAYRVSRRGRGEAAHKAVAGVTFEIRRGRTLGIVGESGSGKTSAARAIIGLVPATGGTIQLSGQDVTNVRGRRLRELRRRVQMIYQDPYASLNPRLSVGALIEEPLRVHDSMPRLARATRVHELMDQVQLADFHLRKRPTELSGGQRQRVAIARALAVRPEALLCDEPVSALDVSTQAQVVNLLMDLQAELSLTVMFVAHDMSIVEHMSHEIAVMYSGRMVELRPGRNAAPRPRHPYTASLMSAVPSLDPAAQAAARVARRALVHDAAAEERQSEHGCVFHPRCPFALDVCRREPPPTVLSDGGGWAACHRAAELDLSPVMLGASQENS